MTASLYNIGPDAIADPGVGGGPGFALSRPEWIALQTACINAAALPTTRGAFCRSLGDGAPADPTDVARLVEGFQAIGIHAARWTQTVYPAVVALAGEVCQYGTSTVPSYYPQLLAEATVLSRHPDDEQAKVALEAILDHLRGDTEGQAKRVGEVVEQLNGFEADTDADRAAMLAADGDRGLARHYTDWYDQPDPEVAGLLQGFAADVRLLGSVDDAYARDVVLASSTPRYAWVWPFGTVASAVVAGEYGHRAVEALERARSAEAKIAGLQAASAARVRLRLALHGALSETETIIRDIAECLLVIKRMQGVWSGISADLEALASMVDDDIGKVVMIMMELGIEESVSAWAEVAEAASLFRANAHVVEDPEATMVAWKVRTQFASSTALAA